jgi:hypothetical protein
MNIGTFPNTLEAFEYEFDALTSDKTGALLQLPNYPKNLIFAICRNNDNKYIGNVGIFGLNWIHRVAEMRVLIGQKDEWGKGVASEASVRHSAGRNAARRVQAHAGHGVIAYAPDIGHSSAGAAR